ncbi:MAG TPA: right-handed parallel beta-helix repeat-containing protein [Bryobacteraceae bacterium]|nr:right-handed parallel beta-helix repeat-containing protein [Bryobacteraceae bacterium]
MLQGMRYALRRWSVAALGAGLLAAVGPVAAATLCVNQAAPPGCFTTISAAVAAAHAGDQIQVAPGFYHESIVITKRLSLLGAGSASTIIDATGLPRAIYIDGLDHPGLSGVVVSNFTLQNANFEGLLATNSNQLIITQNHVTGNDRSLIPAIPACPGIEPFETGSDFDCGEGIHLSGVGESFVLGNVVETNAGGILLSDDTGPTFRNLIAANTSQNNPFDCGIVMASHPPAMITGGKAPFGIFGNTITRNVSSGNGLALFGAGAGVGIFTFLPGGTVTGNLVSYNTLTGNGLPGVTFHAHGPNEDLNGNKIIGNTISGNGADTEDAATPGPTGINVYGVSPIMALVISQNTISGEAVDVAIKTPTLTKLDDNNLLGTGIGVDNLGFSTVLAFDNYWGCPTGPNSPGCSTTVGNVLAVPFLTTPVTP